MVSVNKRTIFLYFFLFAGVFNDLLRIPSTEITLFRVLLPFAVIICLYCSKRARMLYVLYVILSFLAFVQSFIFCLVNKEGVAFDPVHLAKFLFYYACITVVIGAVIAVFEQAPSLFQKDFRIYMVISSLGHLGAFILRYHLKVYEDLLLNNQNDYGAMLAMVLPFFYYKLRRTYKLFYLSFTAIVIVYSVLNDCRTALFAIVLQILIIICLDMSKTMKGSGWITVVIALMITLVLIMSALLSESGFELNGRNWDDTIVEPIKHIITGRSLDEHKSNLFRTNATIESIKLVWRTKLLGIGAGNLGLVLRRALNDYPAMEEWVYLYDYVSPHNAFFEFLLEWGYAAVIGFGLIIREIVRTIRKDHKTDIDKSFIVISISSLLWMIGPSGILVDYFIFIVFTYLLIIVISERKAGTRLNEDQDARRSL